MRRMVIETESEVTEWLLALGADDFVIADRHIELLADFGSQLRMPHSRAIGDGQFELRFTCHERRFGSATGSVPVRSSCCSPCSPKGATTKRSRSIVPAR
jgi:hypothetical protein